ncbi:unnamed protein product [marine sediment metagenome]|uniref:Uncharacterized protein n=1 Tax=marine sediment metagenome TaxID=412755 RepID=X0T1W8_9ZZZZ
MNKIDIQNKINEIENWLKKYDAKRKEVKKELVALKYDLYNILALDKKQQPKPDISFLDDAEDF